MNMTMERIFIICTELQSHFLRFYYSHLEPLAVYLYVIRVS